MGFLFAVSNFSLCVLALIYLYLYYDTETQTGQLETWTAVEFLANLFPSVFKKFRSFPLKWEMNAN